MFPPHFVLFLYSLLYIRILLPHYNVDIKEWHDNSEIGPNMVVHRNNVLKKCTRNRKKEKSCRNKCYDNLINSHNLYPIKNRQQA